MEKDDTFIFFNIFTWIRGLYAYDNYGEYRTLPMNNI